MLEWEGMSAAERWAAKELGEHDPLTFMRVWFQLTQGERLKINWHHRYFNEIAVKLLNREIQNAIINVAPGSTKTEFWSIHLPAYCFASYPKVRILNTSYSKDLVSENSERTRSIIKSAEWQEVYGHSIGKDKVDDWTINNEEGKRRHQIFSRSSGGQITGVRGGYMTGEEFSGYITMDDWQKPDDMFSKLKRDRSNQRASNTLRSRRGDHQTPIISIQQRLHSEDVTSFLMSGGLGMKFEQIKIPALINEDYIDQLPQHLRDHCWNDIKETEKANGYWSFFPAKENVRDLLALWESDQYTFMSQYMQEPESLSGGIFSADSFKFYTEDEGLVGDDVIIKPTHFDYRFITADTAQKTKEHNDFSVICEWGVFQGRVYLIRMLRGKWEAPQLKQNAVAFVNGALSNTDLYTGRLRGVYIEDKASGTGLIQEISGMFDGVAIYPIQRHRDKFTRAMDVQSHQLQGKVVLPYGYEKNPEFIAEVASFTADDSHRHDDQTDNMMDAIEIGILSSITGDDFSSLL